MKKDTLSEAVRATTASDRELVISRIIDAPRERVFKAWTDPELLKQWLASALHNTRRGTRRPARRRQPDRDARSRWQRSSKPGRVSRSCQKRETRHYDAYTEAWEPSEKPFMTVIVTFENEGGKTNTCRVRHWTVSDRETHEKMGFHQGWGQCAGQLAALVTK